MSAGRTLEAPIREDLRQKMVFLAGPRQVGKTTLAKRVLQSDGPGLYKNWDHREDRKEILAAQWPAGPALIVLDELHKYRTWKRWLKGEYDAHHERLRFLVTGSSRLDVYRRGGDSLQGRYHHYRLHPFSVAELANSASGLHRTPHTELPLESPAATHAEQLIHLQTFGGFPEPFLRASDRALRRWHKERIDRFFREDVRDLENIRDLSALQIMEELLRERVGSPLSVNSLREDLEVSHRALSHWLDVLDRLYHIYRIRPFVARRVRALRKMPKLYFWDWSLIADPAARFENLMASHLLKFCHALEDCEGYHAELHYLRDVDGREVDFLVAVDRQPWFAVECKLSESPVDPSLRYYRDRLEIPWCYQVSLHGTRDTLQSGIRVLPAHVLLASLA